MDTPIGLLITKKPELHEVYKIDTTEKNQAALTQPFQGNFRLNGIDHKPYVCAKGFAHTHWIECIAQYQPIESEHLFAQVDRVRICDDISAVFAGTHSKVGLSK